MRIFKRNPEHATARLTGADRLFHETTKLSSFADEHMSIVHIETVHGLGFMAKMSSADGARFRNGSVYYFTPNDPAEELRAWRAAVNQGFDFMGEAVVRDTAERLRKEDDGASSHS